MQVRNINGTTNNSCKCSSWLNHWLRFSGQVLPSTCSEIYCSEKPEVGAHVQIAGSTDASWYVVPLCQRHNMMLFGSIELKTNMRLAPANVNLTCGK